MSVPLRFACGLYDRMVPLFSGEVSIEGFDLTFSPVDNPRDVFAGMLAGAYDAAEMSSSEFIRRAAANDPLLVAIPAFPSRVFRHGMIAIHRASGIDSPADLAARQIGVPSYAMTAAVWIRGLLQHDYGVDLSRVTWVQDPAMAVGTSVAPPDVTLAYAPDGRSLAEMLDEGTIDAFIGADLPESMRRSPAVRRLFPDYREIERDYYRRTGIFPIMHVVVVRRDYYEHNPAIAQVLFDALTRSKQRALAAMRYMGTLRYMLPWMIAEIEENDALFGPDPFPYGVEPNRAALETLIGYLADQSLLAGPVTVDDLFAPVADGLI